MKFSSLFDIITDAHDILDFFDRVESTEQLVSRLERLKRQDPAELLSCIEGLRTSVASALNDTLEMHASVDDPSDEDLDFENLDSTLADMDAENQNSAVGTSAEDAKKDDPTPT